MNCWYTIDTRRLCTGTPVTSRPPNHTSPPVGLTSPAIRRSRVVLPASVSPSSVLKPLSASVRLVGWMWMSAPTCSATWRSSSVTAGGAPRSTCESSAAKPSETRGRLAPPRSLRPETNVSLLRGRPALANLLVRHRHALGLLVGQLGLRAIGLAEPLLRVDRLVQPRAATAVGLGFLVGLLHAGHHLVH